MTLLHKPVSAGVLAASLLAVVGAPAYAQGFFEGKTVKLWIGGGVAGGVNAYGRLFARHVVKHLPGKPTIVAKNLGGAGGIGAVKQVYNRSKRDGTEFGTSALGPVTDPLLNPKRKATYDMKKFHWVGAMNQNTQVCTVRSDGPIKSIDDAKKQIVTMGATGRRSQSSKIPLLLNATLDTQFKVIAGYKGSGGHALAFEKGEVMGRCQSWSSLKALRSHWIKTKFFRMLVQLGPRKNPEVGDVPWVMDLVKDPKKRAMIEFGTDHLGMSQPIFLPPGTPKQRVADWKKAFNATMKDAEFLADAKKSRIEINPISGEQVLAVINKIYATDKDTIKVVAAAYKARVGKCDPTSSKGKCKKKKKK